jgi:hypothetical protein
MTIISRGIALVEIEKVPVLEVRSIEHVANQIPSGVVQLLEFSNRL